MAQWGSKDATSNAVLWAPAKVKLNPNSANRDLMFGNTTADAFTPGQTVGMFGVSAAEIAYAKAGKRGVASVTVTANGTGYTVRPTVAFANAAGDTTGTGATATATGKVIAAVLNGIGTGGAYIPGETLTISGGTGTAAAVLVAQTAIRAVPTVVAAGSGYTNGDIVQFATGSGTQANLTVTTGASVTTVASLALTTNGAYTTNPTLTSAATINATGIGTGLTITANTRVKTITLATGGAYTVLPSLTGAAHATANGSGATVDLTIGVGTVTVTAPGNNYTLAPTVSFGGTGGSGTTATSALSAKANASSVAHTGWVVRTEGSGGRAGRVQSEVLVAGGITTDASDDGTLPE